ncbi:MAG: hypothetical protein HZA93_00950 [Verrucomicrobia bacterium]|nr:hypothetical protein [Verrucomicrobiota bacterium]
MSPSRFFAGACLLGVASLLAQPVAPDAAHLADLRAQSTFNPRIAAASEPFTVNTSSREEVRQFFRAVYLAPSTPPLAWTGNYATGNAGDTSAAFKEATRVRINFFRALAGLPAAITLNSTFNAKCQQAALMQSVNAVTYNQTTGTILIALNHFPPTSWTFYSAAGSEASANSNIAVGNAGPDAVTAYIRDDGSANAPVGHRRWLLYPQTVEMGTGDVPGVPDDPGRPAGNAIWILDGRFGTTRPATRTPQVTYPPAGFVPYQLVWPRWSFSYPGADFSGATVTMTRGGQPVAVAVETQTANAGEPTLVWRYNGLDGASAAPHPKPTADTTYAVTVNGVRVGTATQNFSYNVTVFDPDVITPGASPVTIAGTATPAVGTANAYTTNKPAFASGLDWRTLALSGFSKTYTAESGLDGLTATTTAGYTVVQSIAAGAGASAYRLAHTTSRATQILQLPDTFLVGGGSPAISFLSRLGLATPIEVARVQISLDDEDTWIDLFTQTGSSDGASSTPASTESAFVARSFPLAAYAGRTMRLRLTYAIEQSGRAFLPDASNPIGWFIDNLTVTGVQTATVGPVTNVPASGNFIYTPTTVGEFALQARAVLFGEFPHNWGAATIVTAVVAGSASDPARLANLSILTPLAAGETMTLGTALGGTGTAGAKPLLIRAVGPSLAPLGVTGALPDPKLEVLSGPATTVAANDDWGGTAALATAFTNVGAFPFAATDSRDAAIFKSDFAPGNYTVQVTGGSGSGTVIAELYDSTPQGAFSATTPRLVNVSVLKQINAGETLTAGFVIGGTGSKRVLIRAVGPGLTPLGVGGVLADPQLSLHRSGSATPLTSNDNWAGDPILSAAFNSVGAFALPPASFDAAILATLQPGAYTAQASGAGPTAGLALVEVYELP